MSDALDRLKALNDKLEAKLASQDESKDKTEKAEPKKPSKQTAKHPNNDFKPNANHSKLARQLISIMSIDENQERVRAQNIYKVAELYQKLNINEKAPDFDNIFIYKAMNISGIGLKEDDFGEVREGKYCQIIAITYEPDKNGKKKAKNISLSYFGKAEKLEESQKNDIMEFVLRWRYEKAFQNLEHYKYLLDKIRPKDKLF